MAKYKILVEEIETRSFEVEVEADSFDDAQLQIEKSYDEHQYNSNDIHINREQESLEVNMKCIDPSPIKEYELFIEESKTESFYVTVEGKDVRDAVATAKLEFYDKQYNSIERTYSNVESIRVYHRGKRVG